MRRVAVLTLIAVLVGSARAESHVVTTPDGIARSNTPYTAHVSTPDDATLLWVVMVERVSNSSVECSADDLALTVDVGDVLNVNTTLARSGSDLLFVGVNGTDTYPVTVTLADSRCAAVGVRVVALFGVLGTVPQKNVFVSDVQPGSSQFTSLQLPQRYVQSVRVRPAAAARCTTTPNVSIAFNVNNGLRVYYAHGVGSAAVEVHRMLDTSDVQPTVSLDVLADVKGGHCATPVPLQIDVVTYDAPLIPKTLPPTPTPTTFPPLPTLPPITPLPPIDTSSYAWWVPLVIAGSTIAAAALIGTVLAVYLLKRKEQRARAAEAQHLFVGHVNRPVAGVPVKDVAE